MHKKRLFEIYVQPDGQNEFLSYYEQLPARDRQKMLAVLSQIQDTNLLVAQRNLWVKRIEKDLYELRCYVSSERTHGICFILTENNYLITHAYPKASSAVPSLEIKHLKQMRKEWTTHHGN
ncbi:type II toxin-antitoxin system RelE/ParE family toxin [Periweissella beninensis]|uniref:Type II toxin-antitoxin system RelE/ParE family toxin n=1 Tax=Periweissella beninensis TaxID=504936 RepID=A0ABT0VI12_9LACO|nr:type II toxin-antitoxin system RelE/ParE family toxin [Periweissella beninensis]MBM7544153.1 phage-related protein [Periweissella beninensis]MCM2437473.1 type II toxin-antitoxin system RelE/ParE family toxin [Periweissella beninensis]MCT4396697.1 type II toxin-antitoxin system RelE/ParE family toxin [Periweissella beninensis]